MPQDTSLDLILFAKAAEPLLLEVAKQHQAVLPITYTSLADLVPGPTPLRVLVDRAGDNARYRRYSLKEAAVISGVVARRVEYVTGSFAMHQAERRASEAAAALEVAQGFLPLCDRLRVSLNCGTPTIREEVRKVLLESEGMRTNSTFLADAFSTKLKELSKWPRKARRQVEAAVSYLSHDVTSAVDAFTIESDAARRSCAAHRLAEHLNQRENALQIAELAITEAWHEAYRNASGQRHGRAVDESFHEGTNDQACDWNVESKFLDLVAKAIDTGVLDCVGLDGRSTIDGQLVAR